MTGKIRLVSMVVLLLLVVGNCWADRFRQLSLDLAAGARTDQLDWSFAGVNNAPNVLSELEWDDLQIYQLTAVGTLVVENNRVPFATYLRFKGGYGWIVDGDVQDSDYDGDNRSDEYSRSYSDGGDGDVFDISAAIGPQFSFFNDTLFLAPLVGYSYSEQNLVMQDGFQAVSDNLRVPSVGFTMPDLDSSYESEWKGGWVGLDMRWLLSDHFVFDGTVEYHDVAYDAEADWNLSDKIFIHEANGEGIVAELAMKYLLGDRWALAVDVRYCRFETDSGSNRYDTPGGSGILKLNEVNWESFSSNIGVSYKFF